MKHLASTIAIVATLCATTSLAAQRRKRMTPQQILAAVMENTQPLKHPRGDRLPLLVWPVTRVGTDDDAEAEKVLRELDARGIPVIPGWNPNPKTREKTLQACLRLARLQNKLGLEIITCSNRCMHRFCNGSPETAHVDEKGEKFFDTSFHPAGRIKMGCPFALEHRHPAIKAQLEYYLKAYKDAGLDIDMTFLDWEIDGPQEWCAAWEHSKRCVRCREKIPNIDNFASFQTPLRKLRSKIERDVFCDTVKAYFPNARMGNYSVYPHNGYRYWYDFFEYGKFPEGAPYQADGRAKYRAWFKDFKLSGYTMAMPVVYPWAWTYKWYDFEPGDYRWFYNMLKVGSNAAQHTPADVPIVPFVHWQRIWYPMEEDESIIQFSEQGYKELLWHMLLRGHDALFLWCPADATAVEIKPLHEVYAASLEYKEFLDKGEPLVFDVPGAPAPVVSALRLGGRVLVRRTDFTAGVGPVHMNVDNRPLAVPKADGKCQILTLPPR